MEPVAPVMPPKSEVPTVDEESPVPGFESTRADEAEAAPADELRLDAEPSILPPPGTGQRPAAEPPAKPTEAKPADAKPAEEKSGDANLFDEATLRRRSQERLAVLGQAAVQQERLRQEALRQQALRFIQASAARGAVTPATHLAPAPRR